MRHSLTLTAIAGTLGLAAPAVAADFEKDVLPVFEQKCMGCHRSPYKTESGRTKKPKGGLNMSTPEGLKAGGDAQEDGEPSIKAGDSAGSLVVGRMLLDEDHDDFMPPQGEGKPKPLTEEELAAVKAWIDAGADTGGWKGTEFDADGTSSGASFEPGKSDYNSMNAPP